MKKSTPEERAPEVQKARASNRDWIRSNRTWDYKQLCELLSDRRSRITMVKELLRRGFFIKNQPQESDVTLDPDDNSATTAPATTTMTTTAAAARSATSSTREADYSSILRVAEPDFLRINGNLQNGLALSNTEKTMYRYYCEALLVFCHMQRPQAVENLTDAEWVKRIQHGGRVVTGTSSMQIALTLDEEAWFQMYYKQIRPDSIRHGKFSRGFFLSSSGEAVHSVSQDMNHFHELYKLSTSKSQDVRRAVETAAKNLTADQQKAIRIYLACGTADSKMLQPHKIVDTAVLLDSLSGKSEETSAAATSDVIMGQHTFQKDFSAFVARFPVSLEGQPPCKKQRVDSGYPEDATFYLKWRASQYAKRLEYLMLTFMSKNYFILPSEHFTLRKPTAATVARHIAKEGWKANYPKPEKIQWLWKPAPKRTIETDTFIIRCVSEQVWPGLAIKDFGAEQGHGVVATRPFSKDEIVCDFHGKLITGAEGEALLEGIHNEAMCLFFFKVGQRSLCIDAQTVPY
ncbi:hypothetical protein IRJ41_006715 [Triplophysa rosa]|uniref:Uncharacterized protein n=1 Tax=Triplophysa rosa TaxID=992332 RepID=A0A9W7WEC5_TRIRA|nr:hypothetical protein IRJ41_006715 [Triplophysa rosa]